MAKVVLRWPGVTSFRCTRAAPKPSSANTDVAAIQDAPRLTMPKCSGLRRRARTRKTT
jgi:hypothetical protein